MAKTHEPAFAQGKIAAAERMADGRYTVRMMIPPRKGWQQSGMHRTFASRAEAMAFVATLAFDHDAATLNDHATAISPSWGEW
ncbi:MAG: hypothetical protein AB7E24_14715 [Novosphingobium sp.]